MYFLWRRNRIGCLKLSSEGVCQFINVGLEGIPRCRSFIILDESRERSRKDPVGVFVFAKALRGVEDCRRIEDELKSFLAPLGLPASVIWADDALPGEDLSRSIGMKLKSPFFTGALFALSVVVLYAGTRGLFWVLFAGTAGWFAAKFVSTSRVQEWLQALFPRFWRNQ
jgi:hypothetical protein